MSDYYKPGDITIDSAGSLRIYVEAGKEEVSYLYTPSSGEYTIFFKRDEKTCGKKTSLEPVVLTVNRLLEIMLK